MRSCMHACGHVHLPCMAHAKWRVSCLRGACRFNGMAHFDFAVQPWANDDDEGFHSVNSTKKVVRPLRVQKKSTPHPRQSRKQTVARPSPPDVRKTGKRRKKRRPQLLPIPQQFKYSYQLEYTATKAAPDPTLRKASFPLLPRSPVYISSTRKKEQRSSKRHFGTPHKELSSGPSSRLTGANHLEEGSSVDSIIQQRAQTPDTQVSSRASTAQSKFSSRPVTPFDFPPSPQTRALPRSLVHSLDRNKTNTRTPGHAMQEGDKPWFQSDWFAIFDGFNPPVEDRERSIHWQQMNDNLFPNEDIVAQKRKPVNRSPIGARPSTSPYLMNQYRQAQFEAYLSKLAPDLRKEAIEHGSLFRCRKKTVETHGSAVFPRASFHVPGRNTINRVNKQRELRREQFTAVLYELTERLENERLSPVQHEEEKWDDEVFGDSMVADNEVDLKESSMAEESSQLHLEGGSAVNLHPPKPTWSILPKPVDDIYRPESPAWPNRHVRSITSLPSRSSLSGGSLFGKSAGNGRYLDKKNITTHLIL